MKRFFLTLAIVLLGGTAAQSQLLYRISGNGLKNPSYVLGTYHLAPASFADSIPGLNKALNEVQQVYGELDMQDAFKPENITKMQAAQMLPEGVTLSSLLTPEQRERLNALLREVMGMDLSNESVAAQLDKMTPAFLSSTLSLLVYMKENTSFNPMSLIDSHVQTVAQKQGKSVGGFETVDFQMDVLYSAPLEKQVEDLMCIVDNFKDVVEMADFVTAAYFSQDLDMLTEMLDEESESPCSGGEEDGEVLIFGRNANWVKVMPDIMSAQPTLFAVGAGHLIGEKGVLDLLRAKGYIVEGVK